MAENTTVTATEGKKAKRPDPKRKVKIRLRKPFNTKSNGQTVSVNNHRVFIPYGQEVEVPFYIAEVVRMSVEQDEATEAKINELVRAAEAVPE